MINTKMCWRSGFYEQRVTNCLNVYLLDDLSQCFADTSGKALCVIVAHEAHYLFEGVLTRLSDREQLLCKLLTHLLLANF